ncbi:MAG: hypothetical protein EXX96DRAFT_613928 [Benjaminiella poitrasii]|nr:MAG: hypothetical protein EXX96DRAFT_613928 [Benjaminiella poitrasii]
MPRQTRRAAAPSPVKQQTRQAHTMPTRQQAPPPAPKPVTAPPPPSQQQAAAMTPTTPSNHLSQPQSVAAAPAPQQPGLFAQMATTAAGVAVGSAVGHTLANGVSSIFSGGSSSSSSSEPVATEQQPQQQAFQPMTGGGGNACEADARAFTQCLETNNNDMNACQWYLEALKSCQRMAANY